MLIYLHVLHPHYEDIVTGSGWVKELMPHKDAEQMFGHGCGRASCNTHTLTCAVLISYKLQTTKLTFWQRSTASLIPIDTKKSVAFSLHQLTIVYSS